jgi:glycosyltransferase involved in cell wall biosynthesis
MKIAAIILTFNSESVIGATLKSVRQVADKIFVVDSNSTDKTLELAALYGSHIVQRPFENYSAQRNWAIDNLPLEHDWELHLDADERLTEDLIQEIKELKNDPPSSIDGFFISRLVYFLGRPIRHGGMYPIWHMRLFRHGRGRCEARLYDQHFLLDGRAGRLRNYMIDDQRNSIAEWTNRHNRWADAEMRELLLEAKLGVIAPRMAGNPVEKKRALRELYYKIPIFIRPFLLFIYRYFLRLGFLDGKEGLIFFVLQTFWFRFLIDAKMYESRNSTKGQST